MPEARFQSVCLTEACASRGDDHAAVVSHPQGILAVVADGAGGSGQGAQAAETLVMWVRAYATRAENLRGAARWVELLARLDAQIACAGGETTAVIVAAFEGGLAGASVGDSIAWHLTAEGLDELTAGQHRKPLLGTGAAEPVGFEREGLLSGPAAGTLLLASDGLVNYASRETLCRVARGSDLQEAARALVAAVRLKSGALQDDVAVVLARRRSDPPTRPGPTGPTRYVLTPEGEMREEPLIE